MSQGKQYDTRQAVWYYVTRQAVWHKASSMILSQDKQYDTMSQDKQYDTRQAIWHKTSSMILCHKASSTQLESSAALLWKPQSVTTVFAVCLLLPPAIKVTRDVINIAMLSLHIQHICHHNEYPCVVCLSGVDFTNFSAQLCKDFVFMSICIFCMLHRWLEGRAEWFRRRMVSSMNLVQKWMFL